MNGRTLARDHACVNFPSVWLIMLTKISAVTVRFLIVCGALLLANVALGERAYQRTKDGKTSVWNDNPKSGDAASWAGGRDREGYAKGFGTLTWYTARGDVYARYFGNMIRGKFDGPVNAHSKGKTAHALFTDGTRTSPWAGGPAPSRRVVEQPVDSAKPTEAIAKKDEGRRVASSAQRPVTEKPAARPSPAPTRPAVVEKRDESVRPQADTPPAEVIEKGEASAPNEIESQPTRAPTAPIVAEKREEPAPPALDSTPLPPPPATPPPVVKRTPRKIPKPANPGKPKPGVDDSLRSLVGPPSSLRSNSGTEAKPDGGASPDPNPPLSKEEVIDLGNTVARAHGYHPADYQPPQAQYTSADDTWSLSYDQKPADGTTETGKRFTITVDGKTKKTTIVPGR